MSKRLFIFITFLISFAHTHAFDLNLEIDSLRPDGLSASSQPYFVMFGSDTNSYNYYSLHGDGSLFAQNGTEYAVTEDSVKSLNVNATGRIVWSTVALTANGNFGQGQTIASVDHIGTDFAVSHLSTNNIYHIYSPFADANITITTDGTSTQHTVHYGQLAKIQGSTSKTSALISSDFPIVVAYSLGTAFNTMIPPVATEWMGPYSSNIHIVSTQDNTSITAKSSSGATKTATLSKGQKYTLNVGTKGNQGAGDVVHIVADKPIFTRQYSDSDGSASSAFTPTSKHGSLYANNYVISNDAQYAVIGCMQNNQLITVTVPGESSVDYECTVHDTSRIGKVFLGSTTNGTHIKQGTKLTSNTPFSLMFEKASSSDEHNIIGLYTKFLIKIWL